MAYQSSAYGGDHGLRIMRTRDHRVVVNIKDDVTAYNQHLTHLKSRATEVFYKRDGSSQKDRAIAATAAALAGRAGAGGPLSVTSNSPPLMPDGTLNDTVVHPFEREPVAVRRDASRRGKYSAISNVKRSQAYAETRVPVVATLNGVTAHSRAEIQERYMPLAVAELTGRDTNTTGASGVVGGILTTTNQQRKWINTGDYIMAVPPSLEDAAQGFLCPADGNIANSKGRVPWVWEAYNPMETNLYDDDHVRSIIAEIMHVTAADQLAFIPEKDVDSRAGPSDLLTRKSFRQVIRKLIEGYRDFYLASTPGNDVALATHRAALFVIAASKPHATDTSYLNYFFTQLKHQNAGGDLAAIKLAITNYVNDPERSKILVSRPVEKIVRQMANLKMAVEDSVMGVAVIGAKAGGDFDLHLRAYAH